MNLESINVTKTKYPKPIPSGDLGFGVYFSDHLFVADFDIKEGWHRNEIIPYQNFQLDPGASVFHYGQALFEGMKAFRQKSGNIVLFRPRFNYERMCEGAERLCMQMPSYEVFLNGIKSLVSVDQKWVPTAKESSLYLRPTLIGTEPFLGVRPSQTYRFFVIASPVSSYYKEGMGPVRIWVEENYVRAAKGGLGTTKAAANYAGSLKAALEAKAKGYSQVLWLDVNHEFVEEVGTMNVFFVIDGEVHTPCLDGTILAGGVRDSAIQILKDNNIPVHERKIKWTELQQAHGEGRLTEAFGTGTAAVISPIGELAGANFNLDLRKVKNAFRQSSFLYKAVTEIQQGEAPDVYNWLEKVPLAISNK